MPYPGVRRIIDTGADQAGTQLRADASARKSQSILKARERITSVEKTIQNSDLAGDDGVAPLAPVNVQITPYFHELILSWDEPPSTDAVSFSIIRATPEGETPVEARGDPASGFIKDLFNKPHSVIVKLIDKFGRESAWSDPVNGTPLLTAAETIDLGELAMLNRIRGLLPNANLETITDATKLGAGIVGTEALGPGVVTGPKVADSVISGPKLADGAVTGPKIATDAVTADAIAASAITSTELASGSVQTPKLAAGSVIAAKIGAGEVTALKIAANAIEADKIAAGAITTPKLAAGAVEAGNIAANSVSTSALQAGSVKANQIDAGAVTTSKITANAITANEIAATAVRTNHLAAGAVTADVMAAQDAAAFNLWAQNAMIRSAAIASLTADKITAGTMTAGQIILAGGGSIKAGQTVFDSSGVEIPVLSYYSFSSVNKEYRISAGNDLASLSFVSSGEGNATIIQGDAGSGRRGLSMLAGINNGNDWQAWGNATLRTLSYIDELQPSQISARAINHSYVARDSVLFNSPDTRATGVLGPTYPYGAYFTQLYINTLVLGPGGVLTQPHSFGVVPAHVDVLYETNGNWRPATDYTVSLRIHANTTDVVVNNTSNDSRTVRAHINAGTFTQ